MTRSRVLDFLIKFASPLDALGGEQSTTLPPAGFKRGKTPTRPPTSRAASAAAQRQYAEDNPSTYNNRGSSNYQQDRARELAAGGMTGTQANDRARYDARQMDAHYRNAGKADTSRLVNPSGAKIKEGRRLHQVEATCPKTQKRAAPGFLPTQPVVKFKPPTEPPGGGNSVTSISISFGPVTGQTDLSVAPGLTTIASTWRKSPWNALPRSISALPTSPDSEPF